MTRHCLVEEPLYLTAFEVSPYLTVCTTICGLSLLSELFILGLKVDPVQS